MRLSGGVGGSMHGPRQGRGPGGRAGARAPRRSLACPQGGVAVGGRWGEFARARRAVGPVRRPSPCSPFPLALVQEGGGEAWGRTTGAKALFCFTAEMTLAGENEKMLCVPLQFEGRVTEEAAMVGLDGTTATKQTRSARAAPARQQHTERALGASPGAAAPTTHARHASGSAALWLTGRCLWGLSVPTGSPVSCGLPAAAGRSAVATGTPGLRSHLPSPRGPPASGATLPLAQQLPPQNSQAMHTLDSGVNMDLCDDV